MSVSSRIDKLEKQMNGESEGRISLITWDKSRLNKQEIEFFQSLENGFDTTMFFVKQDSDEERIVESIVEKHDSELTSGNYLPPVVITSVTPKNYDDTED